MGKKIIPLAKNVYDSLTSESRDELFKSGINFAKGNLKNIKDLLDKKVLDQFSAAFKEKNNKGHMSDTTFIGINSAVIKKFEEKNNVIEVTVDFVSEIISAVKDKNNKILMGDPNKVKKVYDTWKFSKNTRSSNPNWLLIDTQT